MGDSGAILMCRDLLLASRVRGAFGAAAIPLVTLRDPGALAATVGERLIVDCNLAGALAVVPGFKARAGAVVVGFVSHTDAETIAAARAAGVDRVVARSAFMADPVSFLGP